MVTVDDVRRVAPVESDPGRFLLPRPCDLRFTWVEARTAALDVGERTEAVIDAWTMVVPKRVGRDHVGR